MSTSLRPLRNKADFAHLAQILTASEHADSAPRTATPEQMEERLRSAPNFDLQKDLIIVEIDDIPAGYGRVRSEMNGSRVFSLLAFVHPAWRRKGIGRALLGWMEARSQEIALQQPTSAGSFMHINATQYQAGIHALAIEAGYQVKEVWALLVRPNLEDIPDLPLPAGLELRPYRPEDLSAIWYAAEEAYVPEGGPPPTGVPPEGFTDDPNFQPDLWQIAWDTAANQVAGSVMTYINHLENQQMGILRGYTEGISTTPAWQGRGVARALIYQSLKAQQQAGLSQSAMVCNPQKPHTYRLYTSCGFQEAKRDTLYEKVLASGLS